jgi:hypothetical protein
MIARIVTIPGCILIITIATLMIVLGTPLDRLFRKTLKLNNDKIVLCLSLLVIFICAYAFTKLLSPIIENLLRRIVSWLVGKLISVTN